MVNADDEDGLVVFVDTDHDAVVTAASAAVASQITTEGFAQLLGVLHQGHSDELDDSGSNFGRESVQSPDGFGADLDLVLGSHLAGSPN